MSDIIFFGLPQLLTFAVVGFLGLMLYLHWEIANAKPPKE